MAVDTGDPAGNETNTDSHLTDEEAGAQRGHTARKGQSLEVTFVPCALSVSPTGPLGLPQVMLWLGWRSSVREEGCAWQSQAQISRTSPSRSRAQVGGAGHSLDFPETSPGAQVQLEATRPGQDGIPKQRGA